jgi:ABC-2 type transport system ATP-binding protein
MIEFQDVVKTFRVPQKEAGLAGSLKAVLKPRYIDKKALDKVSCFIGAGEILGLVGANGAGKTTLVKILSGIVFPTSGEIKVLGYRPSDRENAFKKQISLILGQKAQLWWDLTALDCFELLQEIYQIPESLFRKNLTRLTEMLDVGAHYQTQIRRLSLGERMKMELIAALLHQPRVVFLDEPTIGLDFTAQKSIRKFLKEYSKDYKPAMILTSHYMEDIKYLCERVAIIRNGKFVYDGALKDVSSGITSKRLIKIRWAGTVNASFKETLQSLGGSLVSFEADSVAIEVPLDRMKVFTGFIFENAQVEDMSIEEPDIASSIEAIMTTNQAGA